jgi:disulfide bond formation protein DsbB
MFDGVRHLSLPIRLALGVPAILLGGAYISQYGFGLFPCEMCWWQRWPHFIAIALAGIAATGITPRLLTALAASFIGISGAIGGFHAGVEYGWWEGITQCAQMAVQGGDSLEAVLNAPMIRCDVAPFEFLGVSLAGWNFIISTMTAIAIFALLLRPAAPRQALV